MQISLKNKKALVGGSTQGLGKAIAMQLAESGATVILMARNEDKLKQVLAELPTPENQKHGYLKADFANFEAFKATILEFFKENSVDILVNNTNGPSAGTVLEKTVEDYQTAFNLLFQTVSFTTLEAIKNMQKQKFGRIINVSSMTVREPIQTLALSNSIRTAVISWSKTLAIEVAKDNITVNNILTGKFDTERLVELNTLQAQKNNVSTEEWTKKVEQEIPMKRLGKPEEYGYLATFLASDFAAYITGTNIPIDGGLLKSI